MSKTVAFLWWEDEVRWNRDKPFDKEWKCKDYATYTEMLREREVDVVCGEYRWYNNGKMKKAFRWNGENWEKVEDVELNGVYDLFRHDKEKHRIKQEMKDEVGILNDPAVAELCQDKMQTYDKFKDHIPETRLASTENVGEMLDKYGKVILKPRYGSSGEGIEAIESIDEFKRSETPEELLVQRFMEIDGADWLDIDGFHDVRIFVINGEIAGGHVRTPDEGDFLSNNAQGGDQQYIEIKDVPEEAREIIDEVREELDEYQPSIYTVDFMFGENDKPWIVELNSQPGIYYHQDVKKKEYELPMMNMVVEAVVKLAKQ